MIRRVDVGVDVVSVVVCGVVVVITCVVICVVIVVSCVAVCIVAGVGVCRYDVAAVVRV